MGDVGENDPDRVSSHLLGRLALVISTWCGLDTTYTDPAVAPAIHGRTVCFLDRLGVQKTPGPIFSKIARASPCRDRTLDPNPNNKNDNSGNNNINTVLTIGVFKIRHDPQKHTLLSRITDPAIFSALIH